jgi:hypothetical protein
VIAAVLYGLAIGGIILVIPRAGLSSVWGFAGGSGPGFSTGPGTPIPWLTC